MTAASAPARCSAPGGPFRLDDEAAYRAWRRRKLEHYPRAPADLTVAVADPAAPSAGEREAIATLCRSANMALYDFGTRGRDERRARADLIAFGSRFGLTAIEDHRSAEADGVVRIEVVDGGGRLGYIPYTNRAINWHTDGYYNFHGAERSVQAMLLHCVRDAAEGGVNRLLDPEIAYIRLRDADPRFIVALERPEAMTIPASIEADGRVRPDNVGPVFFIHPPTGALAMRFTARKRNVVWRDESATREAVALLMQVLETDPLVVTARLAPGQGLICNNVLHDRSAFVTPPAPSEGRLLLRVRYGERVGDGGAPSDPGEETHGEN